MGTYSVYRLTFKTQLHLGRASGPVQEGNLGLEKTEIYIPADTLFSAICQIWATFYDTVSLTDFLNRYTQDSEDLPLMLTSAFPFASDVYLFPKPLTFTSRSKESKRLQFVSYDRFQEIISQNTPNFDGNNLINGEKVWMSAEEKERLKASGEDEPIIFETVTRPRVRIGSQNAGSEIWYLETVQFNTNCGLWFAAQFDSDETQQKFETLLSVLGDSGIGGERNAGYGLFDVTPAKLKIPTVAGNRFVTLSRISPKSPAQLEDLRTGDVAYTLNRLPIWVSPTGTNPRRKEVMVFAEGSVLNTSETQIGRLVDFKTDTGSHPVYRYGFAWQVGMKGTSV